MGEVVRIAQIMGKMNGGGVESTVMSYYRQIDKTRFQYDFIVDDDSQMVPQEEIENLGGRVFFVPSYKHIFSYLKELKNLFKQEKWQIVHSNLNTLSVFPLYAGKCAKVPCRIAHNHSTAGKGETLKKLLKYALRPFAKTFSTDYTACSEFAGRWLFGDKTFDEGKVHVFKNGIKIENFTFNQQNRDEIRAKFNLKDEYVLGHVGRFTQAKNHAFLIDIFAECNKLDENVRLMLVGTGELLEEMKTKVEKLGLSEKVIFVGQTDEVPKFLQAMDIFVVPSFYEGGPIVGIEAQASDLKCVYSDVISQEMKALDTTVYLSLDLPASEWAKEVMNKKTQPRKDTTKEIVDAGFDIKTTAKQMVEFYSNLSNR